MNAQEAMTQVKKKRYFVATQDQELRRALAYIPGVPLIYLNKVTLVFETPSQSSLNFNKNVRNTGVFCSVITLIYYTIRSFLA